MSFPPALVQRSWRSIVPLCFVGLLVFASRGPAQTSKTGHALAGTEALDNAVISLMQTFNSPGAQLAVTYKGRLVLARGYGVADRETKTPVQPDSLFRIASNSKPLTALAILALIEQGKLSLDTKVFPYLQLQPLPGATVVDARLNNITVEHLLNHTGGWDSAITPDQVFRTTAIAQAAGIAAPAGAVEIIRYHLGRPLDFAPGERYAYANIGYVILGHLIEKASGQSYETFVRSQVLAKAGVTRGFVGKSLPHQRLDGEVSYYHFAGAPLVDSAFPPTTAKVHFPDGGYAMEPIAATGGWVMSAVDYVRLLAALDGTRPGPAPVISPAMIDVWTTQPASSAGATNWYAKGVSVSQATEGIGTKATWFHNGSLPGARTYMIRFRGGISYVIAFNTRVQDGPGMIATISTAMNPALGVVASTSGDLFGTKPEILSQPQSLQAAPGQAVTLAVGIASFTSPSYQWFRNGVAINGATNRTLSIPAASAGNAGSYHVVITNEAGSTQSASAQVVVDTPGGDTRGRLLNLSILTELSGANDSFTLGYVVGGSGTSGTKELVIRAAGPSLAPFGVAAPLQDPRLELFANGAKTGENNDWGGGAALADAMSSVGAFAYLSAGSKDAATVVNVGAGANRSVFVAGTGSGAVLAEIYDAVPPSAFTPTTPRLINASVLKHLGSGMTAGFVLGGTSPTRVVVRAVGPTLGTAPYNVPGVVSDPQLTLYAGNNPIGQNNDWGGGAELANAFAQVGAFALPANSKDAALIATLAPGNYSVHVSGVSGSGTVLIEVYEAP